MLSTRQGRNLAFENAEVCPTEVEPPSIMMNLWKNHLSSMFEGKDQ
jgi:hypothetical protein